MEVRLKRYWRVQLHGVGYSTIQLFTSIAATLWGRVTLRHPQWVIELVIQPSDRSNYQY